MFDEPMCEPMTWEQFSEQWELQHGQPTNFMRQYDELRDFTLHLRNCYGDTTKDAPLPWGEETVLKVLVGGQYRDAFDYPYFDNYVKQWLDMDETSLHKVTAVRFNRKYNVWNVRVTGRPGRDMWYSYPKELAYKLGPPKVGESLFSGTWVRMKGNKIQKIFE